MIAIHYSQISDSMESSEVLQANHRSIRKGNEYRASAILGLLRSGCPNAIAWFVIAAIIQALYLLPAFLAPHVSEEAGVAFTPSLADLYASASIVWICIIVFIKAASLHIYPREVFRRIGISMGSVVAFVSQATARNMLPGPKFVPGANTFVAAIAGAFPRFMSFDDASVTQNHKLAEAFPSQVCFCIHP